MSAVFTRDLPSMLSGEWLFLLNPQRGGGDAYLTCPSRFTHVFIVFSRKDKRGESRTAMLS